ncbi:hypothetical protein ALC60_14591 [Trachymyrmex zeteki]|uniref:Uncharacterized protein n=1 Tax=Mycetomoellerius zeteki TaxID=64791 RepID=A0A151WF61_9HYME|nr:hypothetical protein ALC60_14591 [Trachymyrmex zeteki]
MSPGFVAVQETRGSDLCLLLDLLMIRQSHARKRGFNMEDDSFRLLSFMLPQRPFRYTTGNRQRLRLVRVKSDYGTSGIISSFSKDTIYP